MNNDQNVSVPPELVYQEPPAAPADGFISLPPLSPDALHGKAARKALRQKWLDLLGKTPKRPALQPEELDKEPQADHTRILLRYDPERGAPSQAYLLIPNGLRRPAPAVVVFHATSDNHILQAAGIADHPTRHIGLHLVRRGYVVLCPRCFIYGYRGVQWDAAAALFSKRHKGAVGMAKMLWDGMAAVDLLADRPEVDPERIACVGHSLGAKETLYLAAFDDRIRAAAASEGGVGLSFSNWDAPWYLGGMFKGIPEGMDHHELLALASPRPFLVIGGGEADGPRSWPYVEAALPAYAEAGAPGALGLLLHSRGHDFPDEVQESAYQWLDFWMGHQPPRPPGP
jgi:dienelactone hydrolase